MFQTNVQPPQFPARLLVWQSRLSRIPRWGWALIGLAVVVPVILLFLAFAVVAVTVVAVTLAVVIGVVTVRNVFRRLVGCTRTTQLSRPAGQPFSRHDVIVVERIDNLSNPKG